MSDATMTREQRAMKAAAEIRRLVEDVLTDEELREINTLMSTLQEDVVEALRTRKAQGRWTKVQDLKPGDLSTVPLTQATMRVDGQHEVWVLAPSEEDE